MYYSSVISIRFKEEQKKAKGFTNDYVFFLVTKQIKHEPVK